MSRYLLFCFALMCYFGCSETTPEPVPAADQAVSSQPIDQRTQYWPKERKLITDFPDQENLWLFVLAGQSNMTGRGLVAPQDTLADPRVLAIDSAGNWVQAKEPVHFYARNLRGLDCGLTFGKNLLPDIPAAVSIGLLPTAIGGTSIDQWLGDSTARGVQLLSNFREKVDIGQQRGTIKGILWLQGESDANVKRLPQYRAKLETLFAGFREYVGDPELPIICGQISTLKSPELRQQMNGIIRSVAADQAHTYVISNEGLSTKSDSVHFDAASQRLLGERFARAYLEKD